jgi:hypothetical protein
VFFQKHPWLPGEIGDMETRRHTRHAFFSPLDRWIQTRVSAIRERPFDELDLLAISELIAVEDLDARKGTPIKISALHCKKPLRWSALRYSVVCKESAEDDESTQFSGHSFRRVPYSTSIITVIRDVLAWAAQTNKKVEIVAITLTTTNGQRNRINSETYDVFPAPEGANFAEAAN